jgi:hypothetical protein
MCRIRKHICIGCFLRRGLRLPISVEFLLILARAFLEKESPKTGEFCGGCGWRMNLTEKKFGGGTVRAKNKARKG